MFQRIMLSNPYFHGLLPYLRHLSDDAIRQLPATYFQGNVTIDMPFRMFHSNYISVLNELQPRLEQLEHTLSGRLRRMTTHDGVEDLRSAPYTRQSLALDLAAASPEPVPTHIPSCASPVPEPTDDDDLTREDNYS